MNINIDILHLDTRDVTLANGLPFLKCCVPHNMCDGLLLFTGRNTIASVPKQNKFYLFEFDSGDGRG